MDMPVEEDSVERMIAAALSLDRALGERLRELQDALDRDPAPDEPDEASPLPPLIGRSVSEFLQFCRRAGPALDLRFLPGRDEDGRLGAQFRHERHGTVSIDFRADGEAWLAWVNGPGRRGSCRCPAADLLTPLDPILVSRWLA